MSLVTNIVGNIGTKICLRPTATTHHIHISQTSMYYGKVSKTQVLISPYLFSVDKWKLFQCAIVNGLSHTLVCSESLSLCYSKIEDSLELRYTGNNLVTYITLDQHEFLAVLSETIELITPPIIELSTPPEL